GGRGGRRSLPLAVTRTPPHEWAHAGPPLPHAGTSHAAGDRAEASARVHAVPSAADAGSRGAVGTGPNRRATGTPPRAHAVPQQARSPQCRPRPRQSPGARTPDPDLGPCGAQLGAATPGAETPARSGDPVARRAVSPQAAASQRSLLAAAPGPTEAQLSSRQSHCSLNNGAPGRGRRRRFSPCSPLRIRLGSRSCSWRKAAAGKHTAQVHTAPPAARRPPPRPQRSRAPRTRPPANGKPAARRERGLEEQREVGRGGAGTGRAGYRGRTGPKSWPDPGLLEDPAQRPPGVCSTGRAHLKPRTQAFRAESERQACFTKRETEVQGIGLPAD
uniref:Uncharacterized protein n=1 Tax=Macaca mulatta TaxID=9544 RepID=A0A5F7ZCF9_MACMU